MKKLLILFIAIAVSTNQSFAANATGDVRARVVGVISIFQTQVLNFGSFSSSATLGTINQAGTATGGVTAVSGGETRTAGIFSVSGDDSSLYTFTLPATTTIGIGGSGGTNQMTTTLSFASGTSSRSFTSGADSVTVNGVLAVAANQAAGAYTGTYEVTANY